MGNSGEDDRRSSSCRIRASGNSHQRESSNCLITDSSNLYRTTFAGFPATTEYGATSLLTTAPAPITAPVPILTPLRIVVFAQIQTSCPTSMSPLDEQCPCELRSIPNSFDPKGYVVTRSVGWLPPSENVAPRAIEQNAPITRRPSGGPYSKTVGVP